MKSNKTFTRNIEEKQTNEYSFFPTKHNKMPPKTSKHCCSSDVSKKYEFDIYDYAQ